MKIATVKFNGEEHNIFRKGRRLDQGGDGVEWHSLCGDRIEVWGAVLQALFHGRLLATDVRLTSQGKRFYRVERGLVVPRKRPLVAGRQRGAK